MKKFKKFIPFFLVVLLSLFIGIISLFWEYYYPVRNSHSFPSLALFVGVVVVSIIFLKFFKTVKEFVLYFFVFLFIYSFFIFVLNMQVYVSYLKYCSNRVYEAELKLRKELLKTEN